LEAVVEPIYERPNGIICLERELLVRDFVAALNERRFGRGSTIEMLLHEDIVYRPSVGRCVRGREEVMRMCGDVNDAFEAFIMSVDWIIAEHEIVLVEHTTWAKLETTQIQEIMGFSSFRFQNDLIVEWHQVHA